MLLGSEGNSINRKEDKVMGKKTIALFFSIICFSLAIALPALVQLT
jgi:hypothetical protein